MINLDDYAVYVFHRGDIPLDSQPIQLGHAILKMAICYRPEYAEYRMVNLDVGMSQKPFDKALRRLQESQIPHVEYLDLDHLDWGITAVATIPLTKEQSLPLAKYRVRHYSPGVPFTTESLASMPTGEPKADVAQLREHHHSKVEVVGENPSVSSNSLK